MPLIPSIYGRVDNQSSPTRRVVAFTSASPGGLFGQFPLNKGRDQCPVTDPMGARAMRVLRGSRMATRVSSNGYRQTGATLRMQRNTASSGNSLKKTILRGRFKPPPQLYSLPAHQQQLLSSAVPSPLSPVKPKACLNIQAQ